MAPKKIYLHIGLHKTGTTYLQNVFRANRTGLRRQGILFPGGKGEPRQTLAVWDLEGRQPWRASDARIAGSWERMARLVRTSDQPAVLISDEHLSLLTLKKAKRAVATLEGREVHVVVTCRDVARVAVSSWQESVKNNKAFTWRQYAEAIKDPSRSGVDPARAFWLRQDLPAVCGTWEAAVPTQRVHLVTVPPPGAPPGVLLSRVGAVVGFDPSKFTEEPTWTNESAGVAGTEIIRRLNEHLAGRLNQPEHDLIVKRTLVRRLAQSAGSVPFSLPMEDLEWAIERANTFIDALSERGYPVVGDLAELRPEPGSEARRPDDASDEELLEAALDAMTVLAENYAKTWWAATKASVEDVPEAADSGSRVRRWVFRSQRKAAQLADRNRVAAAALGLVLKLRERARRRAVRKR